MYHLNDLFNIIFRGMQEPLTKSQEYRPLTMLLRIIGIQDFYFALEAGKLTKVNTINNPQIILSGKLIDWIDFAATEGSSRSVRIQGAMEDLIFAQSIFEHAKNNFMVLFIQENISLMLSLNSHITDHSPLNRLHKTFVQKKEIEDFQKVVMNLYLKIERIQKMMEQFQ